MINIRKSDEIYHKSGGWFGARWHFSFDDYYDSNNMGFGTMRVFSDGRLVPGAIWPMHSHRDIEGLTSCRGGTFRHADSLGNGGVFAAGSVRRMTLGSGAHTRSKRLGDRARGVRPDLDHTPGAWPAAERRAEEANKGGSIEPLTAQDRA